MPLFGQILENEGERASVFSLQGIFFKNPKKKEVDLKVMHIN